MTRRYAILATLALTLLCFASCRPNDSDDWADASSAFERQNVDFEWIKAASGPWGTLEYRRFYLPLPKSWLDQPAVAEKTVWKVPKVNATALADLIATTPLSEEERRLWRETCQVELTAFGVEIHPSKEFRRALSPRNRTMLYVWLGQFPENDQLAFPFCYKADAFDEWLHDSRLTSELSQSLRKLLYVAGDSVCFADLELIEEQVESQDERVALLGVLYRHPYCEVRLRIDQKSDLKALSTYWGEWNRVERVKRKLKEALGSQPEVYVSLANIIPPYPRSLLNTFPTLKKEDEFHPDCYWTAFNFFNRTPDNRFADNAFMEEALAKYHDRVEGSPRYGDLIFLVDASGRPIHGAVYLADDLVFTKNGGHFTQPWVIMKLADMKACYMQPTPLREAYYRWNPQKTRPKAS